FFIAGPRQLVLLKHSVPSAHTCEASSLIYFPTYLMWLNSDKKATLENHEPTFRAGRGPISIQNHV
ncbi:hypothetical protein, partial [Escherichia coli]